MIAQRSAYEHNLFLLELARCERWLRRRHGRLFGLLEADEDEVERYPISLRHIFVPMRLDTEDLADEEVGRGEALDKEQPLGQDAWEVLAEHSFAIVSGRPGSGKSTLMQAIVLELCSERSSELRNKLYKDAPGVTVLPIVLRELEDIDQIQDWRQLLDSWWALIERDANADNYPLSILELRERLEQRELERNYTVLLLLDGIDEVGSNAARERLGDMAEQIHDELGYRVIITGRPAGVQDLHITKPPNWLPVKVPTKLSDQPPAQTFYLQPLIGAQITLFIDKWLNSRPDWRREKAHLQRSFNEALHGARGDHLLKLVRRPIFLTLMALVHCAAKQMPDGRAQLYAKIIDLYLNRQEKHRRLRFSKGDGSLPNWLDTEKRAVLGYIAWRSQIHRSAEEENKERKDSFIWRREELLAEIQHQLSNRKYGRFDYINVADADDLLNYFLQPAGLLIEPAEQRLQFSHLSFQEYLCADFIKTTLGGFSLKSIFKSELLDRLNKPGWEEVGLLLLAILQAQDNKSHLTALTWLDPSNAAQAQLLVSAISGGELGFRSKKNAADLDDWAPLALACCLLHPRRYWGSELVQNPQLRAPALKLLEQLFGLEPSACMEYLGKHIAEHRPWGMSEDDAERIARSIAKRWNDPKSDNSWDVDFGADEARAHALLGLLNSSAWLAPEKHDSLQPIAETEWQERLAAWLLQVTAYEDLLWVRNVEHRPKPTNTALELDALLPASGKLYQATLECLPLDCLLLQGEMHKDHWAFDEFSQPIVLLTLLAQEKPPTRCRIALLLYQVLILGESWGKGVKIMKRKHSQCDSQSRSHSLSRSNLLSQHTLRTSSLFKPILIPRSKLLSLLPLLSLLRSRPWSFSIPMLFVLSQSLSVWLTMLEARRSISKVTLAVSTLAISQIDDLGGSALSLELSSATKRSLKFAIQTIQSKEITVDQFNPWAQTLEVYCYRWAALDWFREQSQDVGLAQRRGIKNKQPLPAELGLFDSEGMPLPTPQRANVERLLEWLEDDERVIAFGADDATPEELEIIRADLEILRHQPWSPAAFVRAILADWPEDQATMDCSLAAADAELGKQSELLLASLGERVTLDNG